MDIAGSVCFFFIDTGRTERYTERREERERGEKEREEERERERDETRRETRRDRERERERESVSYTYPRAHDTREHLVCRLLREKKNNSNTTILLS